MKDSPLFLLVPTLLIIGVVGWMFGGGAQVSDEAATMATSTEMQAVEVVATTTPVVNGEVKETSGRDLSKVHVTAVLKSSPKADSGFKRTADIFVASTFSTAGIDSRSGRVEKSGTDTAVESSDGSVVEIEFGSFYEYERKVRVAVVGLVDGEYELGISMTDASGVTHEFSYASSTSERVVDTYEFMLDSAAVSVHRSDLRNREAVWPNIEDDAGVCDAAGLERQLVQLLTNAQWGMEVVPLVKKQVGFIREMDPYPLPFETEKVCAISMDFKNEHTGSLEEFGKNPKLVSSFGYSSELVTVGGEEFGQSPADGPLGSFNSYPLTQTGNEIQFLTLSEGVSLIPINPPVFSVCPCAKEYQAVLTAPMYPKD